MATDVTQLLNNENPRVSQLNVNSKTYEIWDGTARNAIKELQDILYGLNTASESDLDGMIEKVNAIYNELTKLGNDNEGLASSVLDTLFSKFTGDKANFASVADKIGTDNVGSNKNPVYIQAGVPTAVAYSTSKGGPTADATLTSGGTFIIPYVHQAAGGQVTVSNRTMKMPTLLAIGDAATDAASATHTHTATLATDSTTNPDITLASASTYKLTAGGDEVTFKMPAAPTWSTLSGAPTLANVATSGSYNDLSDKPSLLELGTTATTAAAGNHTHDITLATSTGTSTITLASAGKYQLTAGGESVIFTMPTLLTLGSSSTEAAAGDHTHTTSIATSTGTSAITLASGTKYQLNAGGTSVIFTMPTIPTVNDAALTISGQDGSSVAFTANASTAVTKTVSLYEKSAPSSDNNFTLELGIKFE